jgi:hypothetical protein
MRECRRVGAAAKERKERKEKPKKAKQKRMILVATQVLAVATRWLNIRSSLSVRSLRCFAAIPVFSVAVGFPPSQEGQSMPLISH